MGKKPLNESQVKTLRKLTSDSPLHSLLLNLSVDLMLRASDLLRLKVSDVLQTLLKNEKEGCSVFHGFCSEKGIWEYGELELEQLFSIEKLALYVEVHI